MGVSFDRDARVAGYRLSVFKNALHGFKRTSSPGQMIDLKSVFPLRRDGAIVFEECLDRGLIEKEGNSFKLTEAGDIIWRGKAAVRAPLDKAKAVLEDLIKSIERFNGDPDGMRFVDQVWLYGSVLHEKATVGDIDLAIVDSRRPKFVR